MNKTFKEAFKVTMPVLLGYLSIGFAFGLMIQSIGLNFIWAGGMSLTIYAGTLQYLAVVMFQGGMSLISVALMSFFVNFRHMVYGLSLIEPFKGISFFKKLYMIFALTDETYALLTSSTVPESVKHDKEKYYFYISILDQSYWIIGSILGATIGSIININTNGVSFAMIALFCVLCVEQWMNLKDKTPVFIGGFCGILSLVIFGADNMMIPAIIGIITLLLLDKKREEKEGILDE
ncbi:AzlC family ABC transporter permease [Anaerofustis stercorihominis]|uniref:AzlC family ABC transporter permease n=1 Tax=Anaerofustis stercorihominis TaxID=214853 RepID=UPI00214AD3AA|nr:AzlC family ABC transporter permease [Anaerofustis stercorihominis]MCR2032781.1 AzlC family ABC transporter permease [Anaerofustis stercorihominis]